MSTIEKLTPNRDLQCYFFEPSAVAALSSTSSSGFTVSGTWRQQFDWAVIEWNRDNTHEHPAFRYLPDSDLSGLVLSYQETRTNCIPMDSALFATVDWPSLRIWATSGGVESIYYVTLYQPSIAMPIAGSFQCAYADFTLSGTVASADYVGLAFLEENYTYQVTGSDTLSSAVTALTALVNSTSTQLAATQTGTTIRLYYTAGQPLATSTTGENGNRFGVYSYATGAEIWDAPAKTFANGTSPTQWQVTIDFGSLTDRDGNLVPTNNIRKMRWTYAADQQAGEFVRSEFQVVVSNWTVTGTNQTYSVAGPGTQRTEDDDPVMVYAGSWSESRGNFSGGTIQLSTTLGNSVTYQYNAMYAHTLYLGTQYTASGAQLSITVDGVAAGSVNLLYTDEQALIRWPIGEYSAGPHNVTVTHAGPNGNQFYFDFFELAVSTTTLPTFPSESKITLATDWDTEHSLVLAPERTAWMIQSLGFTGRQNHYVGALWFYELVSPGNVYASGSVTFSGTPVPGYFVTVTLAGGTLVQKAIHNGDTAQTIATAFALELNNGYTGVWASASGNVVAIYSRTMGSAGNSNTLSASTTSGGFTATASGTTFTGGMDGAWLTDLTAMPRLNRAVRDWSLSFFTALNGYGIDMAASFSMELGNGDPSATAGIAQVGPAGDPILLPTPSLQTNFSSTSLAFWQEAYAEIAGIQAAAGLQPYLQFGEVQWWYFPNNGAGVPFSGMPFYDAWNQSQFESLYGHPMATITTNTVSPASYPDEVAYLPTVIGNFTNAVMSFVRTSQPTCRFEVLFPLDVNQTSFNMAINYPTASWTPSALTCLKTECFGFTLARNLDASVATIDFGTTEGFPASQRSYLTGISDSKNAWLKEVQMAEGKGLESVVLFALDQFCLIGYDDPLPESFRRSLQMGR
ncbi:MAG: hypothetical protein ABSB35_12760 [Bryobacteraceae bacterium]|jgi:hypothetical protein